MLRIAEYEDIPDILRMCLSFKEASPYSFLTTSEDRIRNTIRSLIEGDRTRQVVILAIEDGKTVGMVAGVAQEFLFSDEVVAGELVWWVDPEHRRGTTHGKDLHTAFEYWGKKIGARVSSMALLLKNDKLADKVETLYKRNGYTLAERAFFKDLK